MSDAALPEPAAERGSAAPLLSDDRLARRATRGDRRAFAAIFRRYHQPLFRYCAAILGNPEDAHDALQNTMVKVLRSLPGERRQVRLKPWLYRIAHNESIELLRRRRPLEQLDPDLLVDEGDPAQSAAARERLRQLIGDLDELPERQRGSLVMRELGGLSFEQIGEAFETSPAVARQTVYEARLGLQQMSEGREMPCEEVCRALSDGDRRVVRRRDIRAHLRVCTGCRSFREGIEQRRSDLAAIAPLPAVAAAGLLHSITAGTGANAAGGAGAGVGAGVAGAGASGAGAGSAGSLGAAAGGLGKAIAGSVLLKSAATVAVVAAVGVSAADRSGIVHVIPGEGGGSASPAQGSPAAPSSTAPKPAGIRSGAAAPEVHPPVGGAGAALKGASTGHAAASRGAAAAGHAGSAAGTQGRSHRRGQPHHGAAAGGHQAASRGAERGSQNSVSGSAAAHGATSHTGGNGSAAGGRSGESRSPQGAEGAANAQTHQPPKSSPPRGEAPSTPQPPEGAAAGGRSKPAQTPEPTVEAAGMPRAEIETAAPGTGVVGAE